jgi:hypothetical protein
MGMEEKAAGNGHLDNTCGRNAVVVFVHSGIVSSSTVFFVVGPGKIFNLG